MKEPTLPIEAIEKNYEIKVLFACRSGSRAWGLSSPDSDTDLALFYHRSLRSYVSLNEIPDTIDLSLHSHFDGYGWDIRKVLKGLLSSNASLFDYLQVLDAYIADAKKVDAIKTLAQQCFDERKVIFHYLGLGNHLIHKYKDKADVPLKSYLLLIRATLAATWVMEKKTAPPILFSELLSIAEKEPATVLAIHKVMQLKRQSKSHKRIPKIAAIDSFIKYYRRLCSSYAEGLLSQKDLPVEEAEQLLWDIVHEEGTGYET
ncbi:MAG TPA: hypothetical protein ENJ45_04585 [Phaeodactylibacter sp.]|nr:hypothetical protein [Phaeodactylibacter sp.]